MKHKPQQQFITRFISVFVTVLALCAMATTLSASDSADLATFTQKDKAFYLDATDASFIRPGLTLEILDVSIPADRMPEVWFTITDPAGLPLDRDGILTPGPVSTSFVLSFIPQGDTAYKAYTTRVATSPITGDSAEQGSSDPEGEYTMMATGEYIYKFSTVLPDDYDVDATHTLGIYARRDLREFGLDRYVDNVLEHFVPSGASEPAPRDIVSTETCNGRCHDPLALHGGSRQEVGLCILCHNPTQGIDPDTGNSVFFPHMIHKIHAGAELTNGYTIIGFRQSVHDYSEVEFPGVLNDCEGCHTGGTPTADFPMVANPPNAQACKRKGKGSTTLSWDYDGRVEIRKDSPDGKVLARGNGPGEYATRNWVRDGTVFYLIDRDTGEPIQDLTVNTTILGCVGEAPGSPRGEAAVNHTAWLTHPTRAACGACHDDVNFETGEGHSELEFQQGDDSLCPVCHIPDSGEEYDRSIRGAHTVDYKSKQLGGVLVQIDKVTQTGPGQYPRVVFWLSDKNGKLNPDKLGRLRFSIAGMNDDYDYYLQEDALGALTKAGTRKWAYQFENPMPMDAEGSFSLGVEGRIDSVVINPGAKDEFTLRDTMQNFTVPIAVTDEVAQPRRKIVDDAKCESCHQNLSLHGGNRHDPQYCVTCHQPEASDLAVRSDDNLPAQSIHFKYLIHKIHRGADLENGFTVLGFRGSVHDFSHVEFPGDLRNCENCHVEDSQQLPLPAGLLATPTPYDFIDPMEPATAACLSCHDSFNAAAHASANTGPLGETCATCHGADRAFSVDQVHAR